MEKSIIRAVDEICKTLENVPLSEKSSFRIGGNAALCAFPSDEKALCGVVSFCAANGVKYAVLGNMTNVLAPDDGYDGVIVFTTAMTSVGFADNVVTAECGASITSLSVSAAKRGLGGLEFAYGIPGSVGGAVFMNAGAYGGEMKDVTASVKAFDPKTCAINEYGASECGFGYRTSRFKTSGEIILSATLDLNEGDAEKISEVMNANMKARKEKQPLDKPSAGSTFKRPEGAFAGALIEQAGLKGYSIGGAQVSEKHAGFVVNSGGAGEKDVRKLIEYIKSKVYETSGVTLEEEIVYLK